jgi:DNA-directed RNA polymerase specialized sigma24 family protein
MRWITTRWAHAIGSRVGLARNNASLEDGDDLYRLVALAAGFPTPMRQVFTLRKVYDYPPCDIARMLGRSKEDVESDLVAAALACAHLFLAPHPDDPDLLRESPHRVATRASQLKRF